jgi:pseudouridine kinase
MTGATPATSAGGASGAEASDRSDLRPEFRTDHRGRISPGSLPELPEDVGERVGPVVVIGAANMDLKARSLEPLERGTSNPGSTVLSAGGVGRNVAENLARLGSPVELVSVVGDDPLGDELIAATAEAGVDVSHVRRKDVATGTYVAVLSPAGELFTAISDIASADEITPLVVRAARESILSAAFLVVEGNLSNDALTQAFEEAELAGVPVVLDPVSAPKARRLARLLDGERPVDLVTPNREELAALTRRDRGVRYVWARLGQAGSMLSAPQGTLAVPALPVETVIDSTGAGDAMLAAYLHARLRGHDPLVAVRHGHAAAALTVAVPNTVRQDLSEEMVWSLL